MNENINTPIVSHVPLILAPAGGRASFLAALAAEADGIYCGLKSFSARMAAVNFSVEELAGLGELARKQGTKLFITVNTMLKPGETKAASQMLSSLVRQVGPDALILQDLGVIPLAREVGFTGEIHLSTLANVSFPAALPMVRKDLGVDQVVIPRELSVDEVKLMAASCPPGLGLEMFIHGALCYGVSGRCYWSSFLGGKSGLRGKCVQPCRRIYRQGEAQGKFFSCLDFSVDVLAKILLDIPQIRAWKIEGRKKGPHYVYYTVTAYRLLRDHGKDPQAKKDALGLLERALGRPGTHYNVLPQRPQNPVGTEFQTGSGLLVGRVKTESGKCYLSPREALLSGDMLRVGYEDEAGFGTQRVGKFVPKHGRYYLQLARSVPSGEMPVFLVDRMEPALRKKMAALEAGLTRPDPLRDEMPTQADLREKRSGKPEAHARAVRSRAPEEMTVHWNLSKHPGGAYWLSADTLPAARRDASARISWWLPPVIWPSEEEAVAALVADLLRAGARKFVLNAPWQTAFFPEPKKMDLWAGPFCNTGNPKAVSVLKELGFSGVIITPELGEEDILSFPGRSPLPLGIVTKGGFPLSIARILSQALKPDTLFSSPKGEGAWVRQHGNNYFLYPNWELDLSEKRSQLQAAGYQMFVTLQEPVPKGVELKRRPGIWSWDVGLG